METLIVKLKDSSLRQQRFEFLLELLRGFPDVEVEVQPESASLPTPSSPDESERVGKDADFWASFGMWQGRDIDLAKIREESFERRTKHYDR